MDRADQLLLSPSPILLSAVGKQPGRTPIGGIDPVPNHVASHYRGPLECHGHPVVAVGRGLGDSCRLRRSRDLGRSSGLSAGDAPLREAHDSEKPRRCTADARVTGS